MAVLLACENLSKTYGVRTLFKRVSLSVSEGDRLGLIGPNGSGKSTLLKIVAGREEADVASGGDGGPAGITTRRNLRVGYVPQQDAFDGAATAVEAVAAALHDRFHDEHEREEHALLSLAKVGFADPHAAVASLSGGWRKRLAITQELAREPELLLMDEPTNHLDLRGIDWLEDLLDGAPFATVVVTHDRYFLERAVTRIVELNRAYPLGTLAVDGPYSTFLERRAEFLGAQAQQQQSLASKVREDIKWLGRGAKARRTKSKSRIDASHARMDDLAELKARNAPARAAAVDFTASGRRTRDLLVAKGIEKSLGGRTLFRGLDLTLSPGTCTGLLGENGSGKTTLIRVLTGELEPDAGVIKRAEGLRPVVFTQSREELDPRQSLREALWPLGDFVTFRDQQIHVHTWASRFLFRPEQLKVSVGDLSGGEQARILMAKLMLKPADLLVLDEPTNDLDIASLEVLESSLSEFPGAVLLVTHDRYMLDRLSTVILALDPRNGRGETKTYQELAQWMDAEEARERDEKAAATSAVARAKPQAAAAAAPSAPSAPPGRAKLSYKEQRELDAMEAAILEAEEAVATLEAETARLAGSADHAKVHATYQKLGDAQQRVAGLYARWQELESRGK